jgi:hypothetical protein
MSCAADHWVKIWQTASAKFTSRNRKLLSLQNEEILVVRCEDFGSVATQL